MAHDMDESAYEFEATVTTGSGADAEKLRQVARTSLADKLRSKFAAYPVAMLDTHSKTLRAQSDASPSGSGTSTPASAAGAGSAATKTSLPEVARANGGGIVNTSTVRASAEFMTSAEDLFNLLTDASKVPMWSRNPAKVRIGPASRDVGLKSAHRFGQRRAPRSRFSTATCGQRHRESIRTHGAQITGEVTEVEAPKKFVSTWRAPTWPSGESLASTCTH
jgi:uncharacterized protein YndB with AHSA1/START domain